MTTGLSRSLPTRQVDQAFRHYRIIAADKGAVATAIAYAGMWRVHQLDSGTVEEAVQAMEVALESRLAEFSSRRDADGWPSADEFRDGLLAMPPALRNTLLPILNAHARLPHAKAGITELARITGRDRAEILADYRKLGRWLFAKLQLAKQGLPRHKALAVLDSFAVCDGEEPVGYPIVQLRPAFVQALS